MSPSPTVAQALQAHRSGDLARAAALYRDVLRAEPANIDALNFLGLLLLYQRQPAEALDLFSRAIALQPRAALLWLHQGNALRALGRDTDAIAAYCQAQTLQPDLAEAWHQAGNVLKKIGRPGEAIDALRTTARLAPGHAAIWLNLGAALLEQPDLPAAIEAFRQALALEPGRPEAHNILGHALLTQGRLREAQDSFAEALRLRPDYAPAHDNLGRLHRSAGRVTDAIAHYRAALAREPQGATHSNLLLALNYVDDLALADVFAEHRRWADLHSGDGRPPPVSAPACELDPLAGRRLRIGYVSPDFVNHAVAFFIEPVLAMHDRGRFEIFAYSNAPKPDGITARLRTHCEHWRDIARLADADVAAMIGADRIDVLVDLAGHTARHRLSLFARRPAPVQVTWLGYPNTTGLTAIDYRLTDAISDPPGLTERWHTEKLVRLPGPFSVYRPSSESPPVNPLPALASGEVTFGCFNDIAKISPATIALWSRLLQAVPRARLLLKSRGLDDPETASGLRAAFASHGIAAERIELDGRELSTAGHQALYHRVDVALDPFPYNGTTTTCEALWMGVPVVTLAGRTHAARVGASLLTHLGHPEWIAATPDAYVEIAARLAGDWQRLALLRGTLRARMVASPLCDAATFTRHLETAFAEMHRSSCSRR